MSDMIQGLVDAAKRRNAMEDEHAKKLADLRSELADAAMEWAKADRTFYDTAELPTMLQAQFLVARREKKMRDLAAKIEALK